MTYTSFLNASFSEPTSENFEGYLLYHGFENFFTSIGGLLNVKREMDYRLTPLMMAVIFDRREALCFLLANKRIVPLNEQDFRGYSALHHAALKAERATFDLLLAEGADRTVQDRYYGTPDDLYAITHPGHQPPLPVYYEKEEIPVALWEVLNNTTYTDQLVMTSAVAIQIWADCDEEAILADTSSFVRKHYPEYCISPSKIGFRQDKGLGYTAIALQNIAKKSFVVEYTGDYNLERLASSLYSMANVRCLTHRGVASLIQDGTPNIGCFLFTARGVRDRIGFVAFRDIKKGEPLTYCYGPVHSVKRGRYCEFNGGELRAWLKGKDLLALEKRFDQEEPSFDDFDALRDYAIFNYLINTPRLLNTLFREGVIPGKYYYGLQR